MAIVNNKGNSKKRRILTKNRRSMKKKLSHKNSKIVTQVGGHYSN